LSLFSVSDKKRISNVFDDIYFLVSNEEDARTCKEISDEACKYVPINFFLIIISNSLTKLGDALSNPKTVLAWLMSYINAPLYLIGLLVPIRESGSMLPQILIADYIRKKPVRKWVWVFGSIFQFVSVIGIGTVAILVEGIIAGWLIVLLLILFSLSRGFCSVSSKDVLGKTIPKTKRGRLNGYSASISGLFTLIIALFIIVISNDHFTSEYYYLIFFAGTLWLIGAFIYSNIKEYPGETAGGRNAFKEAIKKLDLLKNDKPFRNFVIARALFLCSALSAPFYIILAHTYVGTQLHILGLFILANGIASIISAPIWGRMADVSSKKVMVNAILIASLLGIIIFILITWIPHIRGFFWIYPIAFFILSIAHSGVRLGRKTYIVDLASGNKRTDYVAVSNTIIGLVLLVTGGISTLASIITPEGIILFLSLLGVAGSIIGAKLPNVE
jgi:MFS family permease